MERITLLDFEDCILCETKAEAKQVWQDFPNERYKIWLNREFACHLLDTPEQIAAIMKRKKDKPGPFPCLTGCKWCANNFDEN